ncbi:uncharacterized protein NEMAJ01_1792 [Nematocida major]|uniref:uncharacterized protein n=1 Tax=Nematocida major TaxID=1912982 RepID=UPI0020080E00|nr:uncharacterized protein NEMAJ01_1792 [Nematocida major]KAH9386896.1 hypothetical protein NEMAJ01_1792 [Nematocida major]
MLEVEDLCEAGFYGMKLEDLNKNEIRMLVDAGSAEVVTEASVKHVEETLDPLAFVKDHTFHRTSYVRATNKEFTKHITNGRLNFNCPEYYFIFHELLVHSKPVSCSEVRIKLKIGAKSFFYFIKKLVNLGIVEKAGNAISISSKKEPVQSEPLDYPPPTHLLKHVPIYTQIKGMLLGPDGTSTQMIKERLGIKNRQAHAALRHVLCEFKDQIKVMTEFEGKTRRLRYILNEYYEQQKKKFEEKTHASTEGALEPQNEYINTEMRTQAIEGLVLKEHAIVYNKTFHQKISEVLGSKHTIDKNTVVRTANASSKIDVVRVYINYPSKTITRNVFKVASIDPTDAAVVECIRREGHRAFSIITNSGVVDYSYPDDEHSPGAFTQEDPHKLPAEYKKYFRGILFSAYNDMFKSESNGYLIKKQDRMQVLQKHWRASGAVVSKSHETVDNLPLYVIFSVFPFSTQNIRDKVKAFYEAREENWEVATYRDLRKESPVELSKHFTSKKYLNELMEYIGEMVEDGALEKASGAEGAADMYRVALSGENEEGAAPEKTDMPKNAFLEKDEREALYSRMCEEMCMRADGQMKDALTRHVAMGVGVDVVMHSEHCEQAKAEIIGLFVKKQSFKKAYILSKDLLKMSPEDCTLAHAGPLEINNKAYPRKTVLECIRAIKKALWTGQPVFVLSELSAYDYFLLEYLTLSLRSQNVLSFSKASVRNNVAVKIRITEEYKKSVEYIKNTVYLQSTEKPAGRAGSGREKTYLETFEISSITRIFSPDQIVFYTSASLFLYLAHNGTTSIKKLTKKGFISAIEIEDIVQMYPTVFYIQSAAPHENSIVGLK